MACSSATLLDLSNELIHMVCRHLPFCDLMRLISTCRRIHDLLVTDSCLWKPLRFELILSDDQIANTSRINSLTQSRLISFCTRLRVVKLHKEQAGQCIPTIFFSKLLSVLAHQLTELCLLHLSNDYTINGHFTCSRCMPLLSYLSGCATLVRLELGSFKFPLINFCADYRVTRNDNLLQHLPWTSWVVADEDPRVGLFRHPDIYLRSLAHLEHSLPLCQLQPQLIPPRATLTYWFPSPLLHTSACAAEHLCDTDSRSTSAAPDDKDLYQCPILFFEKRVRAGPANACSQEASNRSDKLTLISNADLKLLPTLEQLLRDYDPTVQHLDSFMARTFNFPALEELILKNCRYPVRELIDMGFIVRLVRHFTRFRESDAPDSPTHLRLVDLRDTDLFENYPELRLMSLLAPHIEFLADDEPPAPEEYY